MIATFLRDLMDHGAVNKRNELDRKEYEYLYILCTGLMSIGYIESQGKIIRPNRWARRVR